MLGSRRERWWWLASLALIVLIYGTLSLVRAPVELLRERNLLRLTVAAAFTLAAVPLLWLLWRRKPGPREGAVLAVSLAALLVLIRLAELPEEKLHFLEYGLLGGMLFEACRLRALRLHGSGTRAEIGAGLLALVLAGLAGWGDEAIQAILPNRYYDIRDIVFNVVGSSVAVVALLLATWARKRDPR